MYNLTDSQSPLLVTHRFLPLLVLLVTSVLPLQAATKAEYLQKVDDFVSHELGNRWERMANGVLNAPNPPPDGKFVGCGRDQFIAALPIALTGVHRLQSGDVTNGNKCLNDSLRLIQTANKVTVDGYDVGKLEDATSRGQLCFAFTDVVDACRILKEQGVLKGSDLERARTMMEMTIDYRMKLMPQPGMGGMSNHMNNYALGVLMGSNFLEEEFHSDPAFAKARPDLPAKLEKMRLWSSLPLKAGINYPYHYKILPDGTVSQPMTQSEKPMELPTMQQPSMNQPPRFGITEDSNEYDSGSVCLLLRLMEEIPPKYVPELTDARRKKACDWMMDWSRQVMPIGVLPLFGDSIWHSGAGWIAVFEEAAHLFKNQAKYGGAAAHFRDCADRIFHYGQEEAQGKYLGDVFYALPVTDESITPTGMALTSCIVRQQSPEGEWIPSKVILLGEAAPPKEAPFAMFNTFHNSSHSHPSIGGIICYGSGGSVFLHETGYDANSMFYHDLFMVRPINEPFLPFLKIFKDPKNTSLIKNGTAVPSNVRKLVSAEVTDFPEYADTKIIFLCNVGKAREALKVTREAVLEKKSGALLVYDSVTGIIKTDPYACGPIWHVQNILSKTDQGFLCQDDYQAIYGTKTNPILIASPVKPVWIGMAGPKCSTLGSEEWQFTLHHAHDAECPQKNHLYLACNGIPTPGGTVSTLSVFVSMPKGITTVTTPPAVLSVDGTTESVTFGKHTYRFGEKGHDTVEVMDNKTKP